ncbi:class I adenylate-forming enzyme family protein [Bacillus sp. FJAT-27986]|uniref:class I adenylate-forming enzyme family protein n=1 Tax=Bacillus sp. FJAT-27986 TaxID=1743146 RepID=UPI00080AED4B|nr:AMP-binding protein [Bacillus sp. FJAT-27986]OCA86802.1 hypothetical protein A8L44_05855 [Bacillus sp. FJAT-27986]
MFNWSDERIFDPDMPRTIDYPNLPVGAILKGSASRFGNRTAFIYRDTHISYEQVYRDSLRFAYSLKKLGVEKGTVISVHLPTCPQYIVVYYGIVLSGAIYSPINPYFPKDDVCFQLQDSDTEIIITHESTVDDIQSLQANLNLKKVIVTGDQEMFSYSNPVDVKDYGADWYSLADLITSGVDEEFDPGIDPKNDLVHIAYTGGTTGRPKGVMITHSNLISSFLQTTAWTAGLLPRITDNNGLEVVRVEKDIDKYLAKYPCLTEEAISLSPSPLFHISGVYSCMAYPMLVGYTVVLIDRFKPITFLEYIEKYQVTHVSGSPSMWNGLFGHPDIHNYDFSSVKNAGSGSAPLVQEEMKLLAKTFPNAKIGEGYGQTEATATITNTVMFWSGLQKIGTVGHPLFDTEVKIILADGSSEDPLPVGSTGEICAKGPQIMKGYYNKPAETEEALRNGWLHTGDIGMLDEDGFITIVDRKKDMLIYKGYNVYPSRLEDALFKHPAVSNATVIGKPSAGVGEIPKAFVILKPGATATVEELIDFVNQEVVHYAKIRELEIVEEFPVSPAGKILKRILRDKELKTINSPI